jgi:ubiquinone/menaquinone biosynthesis C-methylase UbiE
MAVTSTFISADGDGYDLMMGRWSRRLATLFINFAGLGEGDQVLDAGCGTGSLTFALAQHASVAGIRAVDFSPVYVAHATRRNTDPRIEFRVGDVCALPFADGTFDRTLCMLVLHFIPDSDRAVGELLRVTRPGGVAAAAVWDVRGGFVANRIVFDVAAMLDPKANERRARNFTRPMTRPGELVAAWRKAGFTDVQETMLTIRMEFASFEDYWTPYEGKEGPIADYVNTLGIDERSKLREAVRLAYLDGEADGVRSYAAIAWAVKGTRPT